MSNVDCTCGDGAYGWQCSKCYPIRTVRGMYQQEQQIAKAEEAGLIVTAADLRPLHCYECGATITNLSNASTFDDLNWAHDDCLRKCSE